MDVTQPRKQKSNIDLDVTTSALKMSENQIKAF